MLSIPPATMMPLVPAAIRSLASMAAFMPDPHILLMVVQPTDLGMPAPSEACRAGACPSPAGSTQPMMTSSIEFGSEARPFKRRANCGGAQFRRCRRGKIALEAAHGGADGRDDDDRVATRIFDTHGFLPLGLRSLPAVPPVIGQSVFRTTGLHKTGRGADAV